MVTDEKLADTLNDLVKINNDRVVGYTKAAKELSAEDVDLKAVFMKMSDESEGYVSDLRKAVTALGDDTSSDTTSSGKIYRTWMDVKNVFTGSDRKSILESCEFGEDAAQKAYQEALESDAEIPAEIRQLIIKQKESLKTSHDGIKKYRDLEQMA